MFEASLEASSFPGVFSKQSEHLDFEVREVEQRVLLLAVLVATGGLLGQAGQCPEHGQPRLVGRSWDGREEFPLFAEQAAQLCA